MGGGASNPLIAWLRAEMESMDTWLRAARSLLCSPSFEVHCSEIKSHLITVGFHPYEQLWLWNIFFLIEATFARSTRLCQQLPMKQKAVFLFQKLLSLCGWMATAYIASVIYTCVECTATERANIALCLTGKQNNVIYILDVYLSCVESVITPSCKI